MLGPPERSQPRAAAANLAAKAVGFLLLGVFGAGIVVFAVFNPGSTGGYNTTVEHFVLPRLNQPGTLSLAELRGRPAVVTFFASWCSQCPTQLQAIAEVAGRPGNRISFVAVDTRETGNAAVFAQQQGLAPQVRVVVDVSGSEADGLYEAFGGTGSLPLTAFYSADGKLLATYTGVLNRRDMAARLLEFYGHDAGRP